MFSRDTPWTYTCTLPWRDHYHSLQSKTWSLHLPQLEIWWHDDCEASHVFFQIALVAEMCCFEIHFKLFKPPWYFLKDQLRCLMDSTLLTECLELFFWSAFVQLSSLPKIQWKTRSKEEAMLPSRSLDCTDQDYARLHRPNIFSMLKASKRNIYESYEQCPAAEGSSWLGFHWLPRFEISAGIVQCMVSGQLCNCDSKLIKL